MPQVVWDGVGYVDAWNVGAGNAPPPAARLCFFLSWGGAESVPVFSSEPGTRPSHQREHKLALEPLECFRARALAASDEPRAW